MAISLFNDKSPDTYDAIVVGSGISGGWAAKELCEAGLKVLVLERGRHVEHGDYPTANDDPWDYENKGQGESALREKLSLEEENTGGRSLMWGRQSYRWSDIDFNANAKEGIAIDWPIRYADLKPYYDKVERYIGVSGMKEGLDVLPDGEFEPPMDFTAPEAYLRASMKENFDDRILTIGRTAHLTGQKGRPEQNRSSCQFRNRCMRGCPYGAYFSSNQLGNNVMDHHFRVGASASVDGFEDLFYKGRRANGFYIPRFRNLGGKTNKDFLRGYGYQGGASRENWMRGVRELSYGPAFKDQMFKPGSWRIGMTAFGEILPYEDNTMRLDYNKLDAWGLPQVHFNTSLRENELKMRIDMAEAGAEILDAAGFKNVNTHDGSYGIGLGIHEMGTARMGYDPKTSVLDKHNRVHACKNVYVTDGACMTSAACVNPSLTYMALTVRAAEHAVGELKKMNL